MFNKNSFNFPSTILLLFYFPIFPHPAPSNSTLSSLKTFVTETDGQPASQSFWLQRAQANSVASATVCLHLQRRLLYIQHFIIILLLTGLLRPLVTNSVHPPVRRHSSSPYIIINLPSGRLSPVQRCDEDDEWHGNQMSWASGWIE